MVTTQRWRESASDFDQGSHSVAWMRLVGDIKKLLIFNREAASEIESSVAAEGFRLPIPDYEIAVREASSFEKVRRLGLWGWLRVKTKSISIDSVLRDASRLSNRLTEETLAMLSEEENSDRFQRKRAVSKIRYRLGRLIYIGRVTDFINIIELSKNWPELTFHIAIIEAIVTGDCSRVISLGSNVSQATAQVFRASLSTAYFSKPVHTEIEMQGIATFILNGVPVEGEISSSSHPLLRFARGPIDRDLMQQPRGLLQELSCLHGLGEVRHPEVMKSAFDIDELLSLDALEYDYGSYL